MESVSRYTLSLLLLISKSTFHTMGEGFQEESSNSEVWYIAWGLQMESTKA